MLIRQLGRDLVRCPDERVRRRERDVDGDAERRRSTLSGATALARDFMPLHEDLQLESLEPRPGEPAQPPYPALDR